jgi:hypothetical protein
VAGRDRRRAGAGALASHAGRYAEIKLTAPVARLPVELDVAVPVREFRVRNLLALEPGQVIETQWAHGEDMPLAAAMCNWPGASLRWLIRSWRCA